MAEEEVAKLEKHLMLLRQEYVKLQKKLAETEKRCTLLAAQANKENSNESFISRLLAIVAGLYEQEQYSDLKIKVGDRHISAHKFVLAARSDSWSLANLSSTEEIDLSDANPEVTMTMLRWIYTDELEFREDDVFLTELMKLANRFQLQLLRERCEKGVMSLVNVRNCIRFYQTAEELNASTLMNYCAEIIASHWDDLRKEDFSSLSAQLLYKMIKSKTEYPLHKAIKVEREDVVFLYLIEMDSQAFAQFDAEGDGTVDAENMLEALKNSSGANLQGELSHVIRQLQACSLVPGFIDIFSESKEGLGIHSSMILRFLHRNRISSMVIPYPMLDHCNNMCTMRSSVLKESLDQLVQKEKDTMVHICDVSISGESAGS